MDLDSETPLNSDLVLGSPMDPEMDLDMVLHNIVCSDSGSGVAMGSGWGPGVWVDFGLALAMGFDLWPVMRILVKI